MMRLLLTALVTSVFGFTFFSTAVLGDTVSNKEQGKTNSEKHNARDNQPSKEIKETVGNFLKLATNDAWLTEQGREKLGNLMGSEYGPTNMYLVVVVLISGYHIGEIISTEKTAEVAVAYEEIGRLDEDFYKFKERKRKSVVKFILAKNDQGIWRITSFGYDSPHIHWSNAVKHLEKLYHSAPDPQYRKIAQQIIATTKQPGKN